MKVTDEQSKIHFEYKGFRIKATIEQAKIACEAFRDFSGLNIDYMQAALQAVFDTFPTEPTPEQIRRATQAVGGKVFPSTSHMVEEALKAAMTEPPPKVYPYAEPAPHENYVMIYINDRSPAYRVFVPDCMEFDFDKLEMRLKK